MFNCLTLLFSSVLENTGAQEVVTLDNGCVCCTVRGDLQKTIHDLLDRRDNFDYILIETTGMADPTPVAVTFYFDEVCEEERKARNNPVRLSVSRAEKKVKRSSGFSLLLHQ